MMLAQLLLNGVISGAIYGLVALGFSLVFRSVRFFHFAHGAIYAAGAYIAYTLVVGGGLPLSLALAVASILAGLFGVLVQESVYRPLQQRNAPTLVYLIASFGVFIFIQNSIQLIWGTGIRTLRSSVVELGHPVLGAVITDTQICIVLVAACVASLLWAMITWTSVGKAMRAASDDPVAAMLVGINPRRTIAATFFVASVTAGVAGTLISLETNLEPTMGMNAILKGMVSSIVGGLGSIPGAICGGLLLGIAENIGIWQLPSMWKDSIAFVVLIVVLVARPKGLFETGI